MYKILITILVFIICLIPGAAFAATAATVSSNDLIEKAKEYDGRNITYTGEVIGDIMERGDYTWLNVSDGNNAIGVWAKKSDLGNISMVGRYFSHGDTIEINGVFHRACAEHGGDFDIHAGSIEVIQKGYAVDHAVLPVTVILAFVLFIAAAFCVGFIIKKNRIKKIK